MYVEVAAGVTNKLHRFTYDDYVCIARNREVDAQHGIGSDAFVWDPTEPIATRPLMCDIAGCGALLYCHDGNKNVSETVSLYGTIAAHYEYSSFGKVVLVTSENEDQSTASLNPYQFSSEYYDGALGLVYYNYRHYNLKDGRWIGRDPKTDFSRTDDYFDSAYSFVLNNSVGLIDATGMNWVRNNPNWPPVTGPSTYPGATRPAGAIAGFIVQQAVNSALLCFNLCRNDLPCETGEECLSCCNTCVSLGLSAAAAAYIGECALCVRLINPHAIAICMISASTSYAFAVSNITAAHERCSYGCIQ